MRPLQCQQVLHAKLLMQRQGRKLSSESPGGAILAATFDAACEVKIRNRYGAVTRTHVTDRYGCVRAAMLPAAHAPRQTGPRRPQPAPLRPTGPPLPPLPPQRAARAVCRGTFFPRCTAPARMQPSPSDSVHSRIAASQLLCRSLQNVLPSLDKVLITIAQCLRLPVFRMPALRGVAFRTPTSIR